MSNKNFAIECAGFASVAVILTAICLAITKIWPYCQPDAVLYTYNYGGIIFIFIGAGFSLRNAIIKKNWKSDNPKLYFCWGLLVGGLTIFVFALNWIIPFYQTPFSIPGCYDF